MAGGRRGAIAVEAARTYLLLELDRGDGPAGPPLSRRRGRASWVTGAEDTLVINNNAAAVALAVGLAGRAASISPRGELVEIGGGVRIPEIVRRAGARLVEVGTTNRTRAADFEEPLADGRARLVLRVHPSNFTQSGFVEVPMRARWPSWPTATARSWWTTWAAARSSTRLASGSPTSRCRASGLPPVRTW